MIPNPNLAAFCKHNIQISTEDGFICKFCGTVIGKSNGMPNHTTILNRSVPLSQPNQIPAHRGFNAPALCAHDYSDKGTHYQCSKCASVIPKTNCGCGG